MCSIDEAWYNAAIDDIDNWNHKDVKSLSRLIKVAESQNPDNIFDPIEYSGFWFNPAIDMDDDTVVRYNIVAIDERGYCLYGECMDDIAHWTEFN